MNNTMNIKNVKKKRFEMESMVASKKSQAALEFLMTYGWVIFAVLIAIAALNTFGVFNISSYLPDKCVGTVDLECVDLRSVGTDGEVLFQIQNSMGQDIRLTSGSLSSNTDDCILNDAKGMLGKGIPTDSLTSTNVDIPNSEYASILLSCGALSKGRADVEFSLRYINLQTSNPHNAVYTIRVFVDN